MGGGARGRKGRGGREETGRRKGRKGVRKRGRKEGKKEKRMEGRREGRKGRRDVREGWERDSQGRTTNEEELDG